MSLYGVCIYPLYHMSMTEVVGTSGQLVQRIHQQPTWMWTEKHPGRDLNLREGRNYTVRNFRLWKGKEGTFLVQLGGCHSDLTPGPNPTGFIPEPHRERDLGYQK